MITFQIDTSSRLSDYSLVKEHFTEFFPARGSGILASARLLSTKVAFTRRKQTALDDLRQFKSCCWCNERPAKRRRGSGTTANAGRRKVCRLIGLCRLFRVESSPTRRGYFGNFRTLALRSRCRLGSFDLKIPCVVRQYLTNSYGMPEDMAIMSSGVSRLDPYRGGMHHARTSLRALRNFGAGPRGGGGLSQLQATGNSSTPRGKARTEG